MASNLKIEYCVTCDAPLAPGRDCKRCEIQKHFPPDAPAANQIKKCVSCNTLQNLVLRNWKRVPGKKRGEEVMQCTYWCESCEHIYKMKHDAWYRSQHERWEKAKEERKALGLTGYEYFLYKSAQMFNVPQISAQIDKEEKFRKIRDILAKQNPLYGMLLENKH